MKNDDVEAFCFVVLDPKSCKVAENGDPVLAYQCHVATSAGESADECIEAQVLITDSEGARRDKIAAAISEKFRDRFNISLSTVLFG